MAALTVSTVSGSCVLSVDDGGTFDTVADLKLAIQDRLFQQRLTIGECVLDDDLPLGSLGQQPLRLGLVVLPYQEDDATVEAWGGQRGTISTHARVSALLGALRAHSWANSWAHYGTLVYEFATLLRHTPGHTGLRVCNTP